MKVKKARFKRGDRVGCVWEGWETSPSKLLGTVVATGVNKHDGRRQVCVRWATGDLVVYADRTKHLAIVLATGP